MASMKGRPVMGEIEIDTLVSGFLGKKKKSQLWGQVVVRCVCAGSLWGRQESLLVFSDI